MRAALDARLERLRAKYGHPGHLGRDRLRRRLDLARRGRPRRRRRRPSGHAGHRVLGRERLEDLHRGPRPRASSRTAGCGLDALGAGLPADAADRPGDHRPRAARPHQRPARLLFGAGRRPRAAEQAGRVWDAGALAQVRRQAVRQARHGVALLEHELLSSGCSPRRSAARPVADQLRERFFGPLGLDHTSTRRSSRRAARSPTATASSAPTRSCPRSTCRTGPRSCRSPRSSPRPARAGSIATTADDLARWAQALYGGDVLDRGHRATRWSPTSSGPAQLQAARSPTASASRWSTSTATRRSATPGRFLGRGRSSAGCPASGSRSRS